MLSERDWRPAVNGAGKRPWFLIRGQGVPLAERYYYGASGQLVRYATHEGATRAAAQLNQQS